MTGHGRLICLCGKVLASCRCPSWTGGHVDKVSSNPCICPGDKIEFVPAPVDDKEVKRVLAIADVEGNELGTLARALRRAHEELRQEREAVESLREGWNTQSASLFAEVARLREALEEALGALDDGHEVTARGFLERALSPTPPVEPKRIKDQLIAQGKNPKDYESSVFPPKPMRDYTAAENESMEAAIQKHYGKPPKPCAECETRRICMGLSFEPCPSCCPPKAAGKEGA
jgi:hypothetical protein